MKTDFISGDEPLPVGTVVEYSGSKTPGRYTVIGHHDPASHPVTPPSPEEAAEVYPDGVAYDLWPVDLPVKFGFRDHAVYYARRTSFTVVSLPPSR